MDMDMEATVSAKKEKKEEEEVVVDRYTGGNDCHLLQLPHHLLESITSLLDVKTLFVLSCSCKFTFWLLNDDDSHFSPWKSKCLRCMSEGEGRGRGRETTSSSSASVQEIGQQHQNPRDWNQASWKDLFFNVFYPWGELLGVWQACCTPHGGLLKVAAEAPNITGFSIFTNRACGAPIKGVPIFQISFDKKHQHQQEQQEETGDTLCYRAVQWMNSQGEGERGGEEVEDEEEEVEKNNNSNSSKREENVPHRAQVLLGESGNEFQLSCCEDCDHDKFERRNRKICVMQAFLEYSAEQVHERIHSFYFRYLSESLTFDLWLAEMQSEHASKGITKYKRLLETTAGGHQLEGWWKGSYASHGVEFINITRGGEEGPGDEESDEHWLVAEKISGDPHIWSGKVTFKIDLSTLMAVEENQLPLSFPDAAEFRDQPPEGLCPKFKYRGVGQIAEFGYKRLQSTPIEVIIFGEEASNVDNEMNHRLLWRNTTRPQNFAVNWIALDAFSMFEKISSQDLENLVLQNRLTPYNTDNYQM
jgi:hypothetical protein